MEMVMIGVKVKSCLNTAVHTLGILSLKKFQNVNLAIRETSPKRQLFSYFRKLEAQCLS